MDKEEQVKSVIQKFLEQKYPDLKISSWDITIAFSSNVKEYTELAKYVEPYVKGWFKIKGEEERVCFQAKFDTKKWEVVEFKEETCP